jgi:hypothetical protein
MKSFVIAALVLALCSTAGAQGKHGKGSGQDNSSGNGVTNSGTDNGQGNGGVNNGNQGGNGGSSNGGNGGVGGAGGQGGNSSSTSTSTATGGTAIANGGSVKDSGNSSNTNVNVAEGGKGGSANQKQGQQQGQIQGQSQFSTSSATNGGQSNTQITQQVRQAPMAYAPEAYPTAPCRVSGSAGVSAPIGGVSFGGSKEDKQCSARELARSFHMIGEDGAALQVLCSTKAAKEAKPTVCQVK